MSTYLSILHLGIFSPSISEHFDVAYQKQIAELKDRMTSLSMEPEIWVNLVDPGLVNTRSLQAYLILAIFRTFPCICRLRQKSSLSYPRLKSESGLCSGLRYSRENSGSLPAARPAGRVCREEIQQNSTCLYLHELSNRCVPEDFKQLTHV